MEALEHAEVKERKTKSQRTTDFLKSLGVTSDFIDTKLPKGYLSYSQYMSFLICARAYEYKYIENIRYPSYATTTVGTSVHAGAETALTAKMNGLKIDEDAVLSEVERTFHFEASHVESWDGTTRSEALTRAQELTRTFLTHAAPRINPIAVEKGFAIRLGTVPVVGWIDLVDTAPAIDGAQNDGDEPPPLKTVAVDFKTSNSRWSTNDVARDTQLTLYTAVLNTTQARIDQLVYYSGSSKPSKDAEVEKSIHRRKAGGKVYAYIHAETTRTPHEVQVLTEHMEEVADFIKRGIFPKTSIENWSCNAKHCSFYHLCRGKISK